MAQIGIREYDAKKMFFQSIGKNYNGVQIKNKEDFDKIADTKNYVIKPDMLFGKRGKLGLLGINLSKSETLSWFQAHHNKEQAVGNTSGKLTTFLVEDYISHKEEYYISFCAEREADEINFSFEGGIKVEENWDKIINISIPTQEDFTEVYKNYKTETDGKKDIYSDFFRLLEEKSKGQFPKLIKTILSLRNYYKIYGFVYLEVNPFCFDENEEIILLDMVAKIDDQEAFLQKSHWQGLEFPNSFGFTENDAEKYIKKLDSETGASLKMKILNPNARIWTLLAGGGGSLVMTDTLGALGFADNIGNYGELSGNPDRDFTREYTRTLFTEMLKSSAKNKYLIIAGAIANFTDVAKTFDGIIDVLKEKANEFTRQNIKILVRRGGINEKKGLEKLKIACEELKIPALILGSDVYMTDILSEIKE